MYCDIKKELQVLVILTTPKEGNNLDRYPPP
nr:MAG TPA: hypothetical protein [Caudoviricetes sp.]